MQATTANEAGIEEVLGSIGQAARDAASSAAAHATADAARVKDAIEQAGPKAMQTLTNLSYSTGYVSAYGVVYASVFLARLVPTDNAFVRGCKAGTDAALDELRQS